MINTLIGQYVLDFDQSLKSFHFFLNTYTEEIQPNLARKKSIYIGTDKFWQGCNWKIMNVFEKKMHLKNYDNSTT